MFPVQRTLLVDSSMTLFADSVGSQTGGQFDIDQ